MSPEGPGEQVLVAGFPNKTPEVHIASLDANSIIFKEAKVLQSGEVSLGKETVVALADVARVDSSSDEQMLTIEAVDGRRLVQLYIEEADIQASWGSAIRTAAQTVAQRRGGGAQRGVDVVAAAAAGGSVNDEVVLLRARSQQLQTRISNLEASNEKHDAQTDKMLKRLDGAMQMLGAVQEMCHQQQRVVAAQKVVIEELTLECGEEAPAAGRRGGSEVEEPRAASARAAAARGGSQGPVAAGVDAADPDVSSGAAGEADEGKTAQMLALLRKADEMQRVLEELEALGEAEVDEGGAPDEPSGDDEDEMEDDEDDEDVRDAQARVIALERQKQEYEGMLQDSQTEQDKLLERLNGLRSLMNALGIDPPGDGEDSDDFGDDDA